MSDILEEIKMRGCNTSGFEHVQWLDDDEVERAKGYVFCSHELTISQAHQ
jgi:hypothetical protein